MASRAKAFGQAYYRFCSRCPWTSSFAVCYFKGSCADIVAQKVVEGEKEIDMTRNVCFATYGGWYCGWFQHVVYNLTYTRLYGAGTSMLVVAKKNATDQFIHIPFVCLFTYYVWQECFLVPLQKKRHSGDEHTKWPRLEVTLLTDAAERWRLEILDVMKPNWALWTPAHIITFKFVPEPLRITWIATVSAVWLVILSFLTHQVFKENDNGSCHPCNEKKLEQPPASSSSNE